MKVERVDVLVLVRLILNPVRLHVDLHAPDVDGVVMHVRPREQLSDGQHDMRPAVLRVLLVCNGPGPLLSNHVQRFLGHPAPRKVLFFDEVLSIGFKPLEAVKVLTLTPAVPAARRPLRIERKTKEESRVLRM